MCSRWCEKISVRPLPGTTVPSGSGTDRTTIRPETQFGKDALPQERFDWSSAAKKDSSYVAQLFTLSYSRTVGGVGTETVNWGGLEDNAPVIEHALLASKTPHWSPPQERVHGLRILAAKRTERRKAATFGCCRSLTDMQSWPWCKEWLLLLLLLLLLPTHLLLVAAQSSPLVSPNMLDGDATMRELFCTVSSCAVIRHTNRLTRNEMIG